ncbi:MAG: signal peptidase I [Clostridia bacterium]|nr:signal peptidase I [Clostridia bacterium]
MKKKLKIATTIITGLLLILSVVLLITAVVSRMTNKTPSLLGYTFHYVVSASMEPEILVGELVIAKKTDISEVEQGDYVVFVSPDPSLNGIIIIHKVIAIDDGASGRSLTTSGIKEGVSPDSYPVKQIIGVYRTKSSLLGKFVKFFSQVRNILFVIIIIAALVIVAKQSRNIWRQLKKKGKEDDEK